MKRLLYGVPLFLFVGCTVSPVADEKPTEKPSTEQSTGVESTAKTVLIGAQAPAFRIKDSNGKDIELAKLTDEGPVLVRLTCGCAGCDKELAYFQELHTVFKDKGLTSLAVFREPDTKVEAYVKTKKLNMLYAVDTKGESWNVFQTKTMPANFLIEKGGRISAVAEGCDPSGLVANTLSEKVAGLLDTEAVDVRERVGSQK